MEFRGDKNHRDHGNGTLIWKGFARLAINGLLILSKQKNWQAHTWISSYQQTTMLNLIYFPLFLLSMLVDIGTQTRNRNPSDPRGHQNK